MTTTRTNLDEDPDVQDALGILRADFDGTLTDLMVEDAMRVFDLRGDDVFDYLFDSVEETVR